MKFTKEDASKELTARIPNKGQTLNLSERSINEQLDTLMPLLANEETELESFITTVLPLFRTADGNVRNDVTVGIKKYQQDNPIKVTETDEKSVEKDEYLDTLLKRIQSLEEENIKAKKEVEINQKRKDLLEKMKDLGIKDEEWSKAFIEEITIDESFDIDTKAQSYLNIYNKSKADIINDVTPKQARIVHSDVTNDIIAQAAAIAKSQRIGVE